MLTMIHDANQRSLMKRKDLNQNSVHVQLSYAKSHISWMGNDGKIIGAVVGHPVFNNGKVRLIFFMKTCS